MMLVQQLYIISSAAITPASEPEYKELVPDAAVRRRMSRIVRMGVGAAMECLRRVPHAAPDAILTATGLGCLNDTVKFMDSMIDYREQMLSPTPFIQSTFNTIGAQIALLTGNHCYNSTYVHRAFSLESAFLDASLLMAEGDARTALVASADELNPEASEVMQRMGFWRHRKAGEGAAAFLLSKEPSEAAVAVILDIELFNGRISGEELEARRQGFLAAHRAEDAEVVLPGGYKQSCGEYPTAMGFGLWKALEDGGKDYCLVCNTFLDEHSFILIKRLKL